MTLTLFHGYRIVVPISTARNGWSWDQVSRCLEWLNSNGFHVVVTDACLPAARVEQGAYLFVECAIPATTTAESLFRRMAKDIPDPWRVNLRGLVDRLPPAA